MLRSPCGMTFSYKFGLEILIIEISPCLFPDLHIYIYFAFCDVGRGRVLLPCQQAGQGGHQQAAGQTGDSHIC